VRKTCKLGANSSLLEYTDSQFWVDVLKENGGENNRILAESVCAFCTKEKGSLDSVTFSALTDTSLLPSIATDVAVRLMELEKLFLPADPLPLTSPDSLSSLQKHCIASIANEWKEWGSDDLSKLHSSVLTINPIVAPAVFESTVKQAKSADSGLKFHCPKAIDVSSCGVSSINGRFTLKGFYYNSPRYARDATYRGEHVTFEMYAAYKEYFWYISILVPEYPISHAGDTDFYEFECESRLERIIPPVSGWRNSDFGETHGTPQLTYIYEDMKTEN